MKRAALWASIALMGVVPAFSQWASRTITNADLEVYRQERLRAERDYAQNYDKMGFPSPEELAKQLEKSRVDREELATRLASERLQREQIEADLAKAAESGRENVFVFPDSGGRNNGSGGYLYDPWFGYPGRYRRYPRIGIYTWPNRLGNGIPYFNYGRRRFR